MECLVVFIVLLLVVGIIVGVMMQSSGVSERLNRAFFQLARRFNGTSRSGGWTTYPSARFRYGAGYAVLEMGGSTFGGRYLDLQITYPDVDLYCEIFPGRTYGQARQGLVDLQIGHVQFDSDYTITGREGHAVSRLFSAGVQVQIEKLRHFFASNEVYVYFGGGLLAIRKYYSGEKYEQLESYVLCALDLYEQALLTREAGIEFEGGGEAQMTGDSICGVCKDPCEDDIVYCSRCRTPHHGECWTYNGGCSIFGCKETRCVPYSS